MKFYRAIFFTWAENAKLVGHAKNQTEPACKPGKAGWPGPTDPGVQAAVCPRFPLCVFDFLVWSYNFKGSQEKENMVSRVFLPGLFKWTRWELGNPSQFASSCTQAVAMMSPRSMEIKLGAKEP
jgi:hypothetical protein